MFIFSFVCNNINYISKYKGVDNHKLNKFNAAHFTENDSELSSRKSHIFSASSKIYTYKIVCNKYGICDQHSLKNHPV